MGGGGSPPPEGGGEQINRGRASPAVGQGEVQEHGGRQAVSGKWWGCVKVAGWQAQTPALGVGMTTNHPVGKAGTNSTPTHNNGVPWVITEPRLCGGRNVVNAHTNCPVSTENNTGVCGGGRTNWETRKGKAGYRGGVTALGGYGQAVNQKGVRVAQKKKNGGVHGMAGNEKVAPEPTCVKIVGWIEEAMVLM